MRSFSDTDTDTSIHQCKTKRFLTDSTKLYIAKTYFINSLFETQISLIKQKKKRRKGHKRYTIATKIHRPLWQIISFPQNIKTLYTFVQKRNLNWYRIDRTIRYQCVRVTPMLPLYNKTFEHRLDDWESSSTDYIAWLSCVTFTSNTWAIHEAGQFAWSRVKKLYTTDTLPFAPGFYPTVAILHSLEKTVYCRSNRFAGKKLSLARKTHMTGA